MFISMVVLSCLCAKYASDFNLNNQHEATPSLFESLTASAVCFAYILLFFGIKS